MTADVRAVLPPRGVTTVARARRERSKCVVIRPYFSMASLSRSHFPDQQIHAHIHVQIFQRPRLALQATCQVRQTHT